MSAVRTPMRAPSNLRASAGQPVTRLHGDEGSVLIETAFVAPVLLIFFLAMIEFGMFFRDSSTANSAVFDGAKFAAIQGPLLSSGQTADYTAFKAIRENLAGIKVEWVSRVVIFKAGPSSLGSPMAQVSSACKTSGVSVIGSCNVYLAPNAFIQFVGGNANYFRCVTTGDPACGWDPEDRANGPKVADIEYLGVYIKINRPTITGLIKTTKTLETAAIQRLEPGVLK